MSNKPQPKSTISNRSLTARLLVLATAMFAFGLFVLPPLYEVFCEITGYGGGANPAPVAVAEQPDLTRSVRIEFMANVNGYAPWSFAADVDSMTVHPGKMYVATFSATNHSPDRLTGQAVPSIAPMTANEHFTKIECFCFTNQEFAANETRTLPVQFIVDPELPDYIDTITLSYTLFKIAPAVASVGR